MYCLFALSGFIYYVLDSEYVVHCGLAFLVASSFVRRHSYLGLDSSSGFSALHHVFIWVLCVYSCPCSGV